MVKYIVTACVFVVGIALSVFMGSLVEDKDLGLIVTMFWGFVTGIISGQIWVIMRK